APVALLLGAEDRLEIDRLAARFHLALAAAGALDRVGLEKEFTGGVGKDNRALVATLADHVAPRGDGALEADEVLPHGFAVGDRAGGGGHLGRADGGGHVLAVQEDAARRHVEDEGGDEPREGGVVV